MTDQIRARYNYIGEQLRADLFSELKRRFGDDNVRTKWRATDESVDDFNSDTMYTPETDLVIKPFNINRQISKNNNLITRALRENINLLREINSLARVPFQEHILNNNPRCFIAIEVGGSGSEKHLLGDMYNASVLGKVGLVVGATSQIVNYYQRLYEYTNFAYSVGKTNQSFGNLAVIDGSSLLQLLRDTDDVEN